MDAAEYARAPVPFYEADPRAVIPIGTFRIPRSVARGLARSDFEIRMDTMFTAVVEGCAQRPGGTWLSPRLADSYRQLHALGYAHSIEAWSAGRLVGGLFGVSLGGLFTSESMFHRASDAGNAVLVATAGLLARNAFALWDIQMATPHTLRFGTELITRDEYRQRLQLALRLRRRLTAGRSAVGG